MSDEEREIWLGYVCARCGTRFEDAPTGYVRSCASCKMLDARPTYAALESDRDRWRADAEAECASNVELRQWLFDAREERDELKRRMEAVVKMLARESMDRDLISCNPVGVMHRVHQSALAIAEGRDNG